jgi:hypothetical protein
MRPFHRGHRIQRLAPLARFAWNRWRSSRLALLNPVRLNRWRSSRLALLNPIHEV